MSKTKRYWHEMVGFNYRLTNLQASIGLAQLSKLDDFVNKKLKSLNTILISFHNMIFLNFKKKWKTPKLVLAFFTLDKGSCTFTKNQFIDYLKKRN